MKNYVTVGGHKRLLFLTERVVFDAAEKYGSIQDWGQIIGPDTAEASAALKWMLVQMVNNGELERRRRGYEEWSMISESDLPENMTVRQYQAMRRKVMAEITASFSTEVEEDEDIDLGLAELNEKK